jgi:hypothetical protein
VKATTYPTQVSQFLLGYIQAASSVEEKTQVFFDNQIGVESDLFQQYVRELNLTEKEEDEIAYLLTILENEENEIVFSTEDKYFLRLQAQEENNMLALEELAQEQE